MCNILLSLLDLCFEQYIPCPEKRGINDASEANTDWRRLLSPEQVAFAYFVQLAAGKATSDPRTLFLEEYADATSPFFRSFALLDDESLIGAFVHFLCMKEQLLHSSENSSKED